MQRLAFWIFLFAIFGAFAYVVARDQGGVMNVLTGDDIAALLVKIGILVLISSAAVSLFRESFGKILKFAAIWLGIILILVLGYTYRYELGATTDRVLAELMPGRTISTGHVVELARRQGGDFRVNADVNGRRISMVLDTGASAVVLTNDDAKAAGLPLEVLKYSVPVDTANGRTFAAAVTLDRIAVGGIIERAVPALIAQSGQLRTSLLGMSFLNRLEGWEVRGDRLVMRGYP